MEEGEVEVFKVAIAVNPAGMLTKALPREKLELCRELIQLRQIDGAV